MLSLLLLLAASVVHVVQADDVVVNTPDGTLRGTRATFRNRTIDTFLGIPFGQSERFQAPLPAASWSGVREAKTFSAMCQQSPSGFEPPVLSVSEDCLFLNVYAPEPEEQTTLLPVMVWIHGGSFRFGTGAFYNGTALAAKGVVVVTINYRLDVLGFLSTGDNASPGNLGLLDQLLALKWVQKSISSFHGNPNDVTIFGESAGSVSVSLLRLSPLSRGLFSKAVMASGVSASFWAVGKSTDPVSPRSWASSLALRVGCSSFTANTAHIVSCLKTKTVATLLNAAGNLVVSNGGNLVFFPVVEQLHGVVPQPPMDMLQQGYGSDVSAIRGVNKDEATAFILAQPLTAFTRSTLVSQAAWYANRFFQHDAAGAASAIVQEYCGQDTSMQQLRDDVAQLATDTNFMVPTVLETQAVVKTSGHASQYLYHYTYRPTHTNSPQWAGVPHASDLPIVFGQPFQHDRFTAKSWPFEWSELDETVSDEVMTLWTNFAKYGTPTPHPVGHVTWAPYTMDNQAYLDIGSPLSLKSDLKSQRVQFWQQLADQHHSSVTLIG